jgi:2-phospho-L-lactate guanylyltransferase
MTWMALIPLNAPARRKSRLAGALAAPQREALAEALYQHVLSCAERAGIFPKILTLSPPPALAATRWVQQESDLNVELARARTLLSTRLLVLNADLPLLEPSDLVALVEAAETAGCALAADRHGTGTNAVALLPGAPFRFAFGPGSLAAHRSAASHASLVWSTGLACDLDTPEDIAHVLASGHALPGPLERLMHAAHSSSATTKWAHVD